MVEDEWKVYISSLGPLYASKKQEQVVGALDSWNLYMTKLDSRLNFGLEKGL